MYLLRNQVSIDLFYTNCKLQIHTATHLGRSGKARVNDGSLTHAVSSATHGTSFSLCISKLPKRRQFSKKWERVTVSANETDSRTNRRHKLTFYAPLDTKPSQPISWRGSELSKPNTQNKQHKKWSKLIHKFNTHRMSGVKKSKSSRHIDYI